MKTEILVLCPFGLDVGLLSKAVAMDENVRVLTSKESGSEAAIYGAKYIHVFDGEVTDEADFARWLADKISGWKSTVVLAPATVQMRNIMPMLAWHLGAGLTADCIALEWKEGKLLQTRPAFGNSRIAQIESLSDIQMATVRPGTFQSIQCPVDYQMVDESYILAESKLKKLEENLASHATPLVQAEIIVAGGLGVCSKEGFDRLRQFAEKIGAAVGASRSAVDAGYAPYSCQVGMTGVTVCPKLYIAVGISGAVQHLAGMSGATRVIAINSDPKAPIFDYADYGIVGDWEIIVDQLLEELS